VISCRSSPLGLMQRSTPQVPKFGYHVVAATCVASNAHHPQDGGQLVQSAMQPVQHYFTLVQSVLCFVPVLLTGLAFLVWVLGVLGPGVAVAGTMLLITAILRQKRALLTTGFVVTAIGTVFMLLSWTLATPSSVYVDDGCYTVKAMLQGLISQDRSFFLPCMRPDDVRRAVLAMGNFSAYLCKQIVSSAQPYTTAPVPNASFVASDSTDTMLAHFSTSLMDVQSYAATAVSLPAAKAATLQTLRTVQQDLITLFQQG
jgi:hypothetical protein